MAEEFECVNCGIHDVAVEPNCCMVCGGELCDECYDESPYCEECGQEANNV